MKKAPRHGGGSFFIPSYTGSFGVSRDRDLTHGTKYGSRNSQVTCYRNHDSGQRNGRRHDGCTNGSQDQSDVSELLKERWRW